ncbi:hypothetical protein SH661x_000435 [Planctomicrobium sp. SH661]|uniref:hypothetical protein n=1 Tax=Planctomicrobium sp. SH661 TaxID=3448124 RepID=UPI003F5B7A4E
MKQFRTSQQTNYRWWNWKAYTVDPETKLLTPKLIRHSTIDSSELLFGERSELLHNESCGWSAATRGEGRIYVSNVIDISDAGTGPTVPFATAYDETTGLVIWATSLQEQFSKVLKMWCRSGVLVIQGLRAEASPFEDFQGAIAGLDAETGELLWSHGSVPDPETYTVSGLPSEAESDFREQVDVIASAGTTHNYAQELTAQTAAYQCLGDTLYMIYPLVGGFGDEVGVVFFVAGGTALAFRVLAVGIDGSIIKNHYAVYFHGSTIEHGELPAESDTEEQTLAKLLLVGEMDFGYFFHNDSLCVPAGFFYTRSDTGFGHGEALLKFDSTDFSSTGVVYFEAPDWTGSVSTWAGPSGVGVGRYFRPNLFSYPLVNVHVTTNELQVIGDSLFVPHYYSQALAAQMPEGTPSNIQVCARLEAETLELLDWWDVLKFSETLGVPRNFDPVSFAAVDEETAVVSATNLQFNTVAGMLMCLLPDHKRSAAGSIDYGDDISTTSLERVIYADSEFVITSMRGTTSAYGSQAQLANKVRHYHVTEEKIAEIFGETP